MSFEFFKKKEELSNISSIPPEDKMGRKTRAELELECEMLKKDAVKIAALRLAEEIMRSGAEEIINKAGNSLTIHYQTGQETEGEIKKLAIEEDIEANIWREVRSDRGISEVLIAKIEGGEKSSKELARVLLGYKELGKKDAKELRAIVLDKLEVERLEKRKKFIEEEERLAKKKMRIT